MGSKWYSGKYDSMKQAACLQGCKYEKHNFMQKYSASMRFEWFFTGQLTITDAQWYDGTYFSELSKSEDFKYFINFAKQDNFLIKERSERSMSMLASDFKFSSINNLEFKDIIEKIGGNIKKLKEKDDNQWKMIVETPQSYVSHIRDAVDNNYSGCSVIENNLEEFADSFMRLHFLTGHVSERPEAIYSKWNNRDALPIIMERFRDDLKSRIEDIEKHAFKYIDPAQYMTDTENIRKNLDERFPNRSSIINSVKSLKIESIKNDVSLWQIDNFVNTFNFIYNYGLSKQHTCDNYDGSDIDSKYEEDMINHYDIHKSFLEDSVPYRIANSIEKMSWGDFDELVRSSSSLLISRNKWIEEYSMLAQRPTRRKFTQARRALHDLINSIYNAMPNMYDEKNEYLVIDREKSLAYVANGSDLNDLFGNSIIIVCNDDTQTGKLICLRSGNKMVDPVIATLISKGENMIQRAKEYKVI